MSFTQIEHDSPEWHSLRSRHIGGSEVSALFNLAPEDVPGYARSRFALWHIKAGNAPPPVVDNPRVHWGLRLEAVIAEAAATENRWSVQKGGYVSDVSCPGLGCTLDYVIDYDPDEKGPGALEVKNVDWLVHKRSWDTEPPPHILLQLMHQLAATGYGWGAVCCLVGGNDLRVYRYKRNDKIIEGIRRKVREFWQSIDDGKEPPVDGSESASAALRSLFPTPVDDIAELDHDEDFAEWCKVFRQATIDKKVASELRDEAENHILAKLGNYQKARSLGYLATLSVGKDTADRPAKEGEIIKGRRGSRTLRVKELAA
jgi:predicted phage-related endonuclease